MLVYKFMLKNFASNSKEYTDVGLNVKFVIEKFIDTKKGSADDNVAVIALNLLSEVLHVDTINSKLIISKFNNIRFFKRIYELIHINVKQTCKMDEIKKILGSCFGCHAIGYNDGIINFL